MRRIQSISISKFQKGRKRDKDH